MFKKVLIPNRGEIALRIIRTCREMGIRTVLAYSQADAASLPARLADEKVCIGPPQARDSYLSIPAIMSAVDLSKADAVHPGYGFLAEDANFASACESVGVKFIGPRTEVIESLGNKLRAREIAQKAGVPVVSGSRESVEDNKELAKMAETVGYPVLLKAAAGGGGRGMKIVRNEDELSAASNISRAEAKAAFGDGSIYIEKYFDNAKHVEIQILADEHGNIISLWDRECSVQRRFQKLIEESPSSAVSPAVRTRLVESSIALAKAAGYTNAGTVEFLLLENGDFYFLEVNARLQVEHPVTESITGIDIIREQILVASGKRLSLEQKNVPLNGHSFEARVNAEDPVKMSPCPGKVALFVPPGGYGVRVDSALYSGYEVPSFYDSLIAKIISRGKSREEARIRMLRALKECIVEGIQTNLSLLIKIFEHAEFANGNFNTRFLENTILKQK